MATPPRFRPILALLFAALLGGCARYEYDLVEPADLAQHVGAKSPAAFSVGDLEYRLQTSDNRLVMMIHNRSDELIKLLGEDSVAVDPRGESHPLRTRTIAPGSSVKLILPPRRPQVERVGPSIGFGFGMGLSRGYPYRRYPGYYGLDPHPHDFGPRYYTVYDESDITFWEWKGESTARLILSYQRGDDTFRDEFVFRRRRM